MSQLALYTCRSIVIRIAENCQNSKHSNRHEVLKVDEGVKQHISDTRLRKSMLHRTRSNLIRVIHVCLYQPPLSTATVVMRCHQNSSTVGSGQDLSMRHSTSCPNTSTPTNDSHCLLDARSDRLTSRNRSDSGVAATVREAFLRRRREPRSPAEGGRGDGTEEVATPTAGSITAGVVPCVPADQWDSQEGCSSRRIRDVRMPPIRTCWEETSSSY